MKKILCLILAITSVLTTAFGSFAPTQKVLLKENILPEINGTASLYYQQNEGYSLVVNKVSGADKEYYFDENSNRIDVIVAGGENYSFDRSEVIGEPITTMAYSRPIHFCNITYKTTPLYSGTPIASVEYTTESANTVYPVNVPKNWVYEDALAAIVDMLLDTLIPDAQEGIASIAELVLDSMMASCGADVVNGLINKAFSDTFRAYTVTYSYDATLSVGTTVVGTAELVDAGQAVTVIYDDVDEFEAVYYGYTPTTIRTMQNEFAIVTWRGCSTVSYPGFSNYGYVTV